MKRLLEKMQSVAMQAKLKAMNFVTEERGDTNFISIAIILVVVIVIAVLFITLGQDLAAALKTKIDELLKALGA